MRAGRVPTLLMIALALGFSVGAGAEVPEAPSAGIDSQAPPSDPTLGPWAVDEAGNVGRIHTVVPGDTLWDISSAYLGTAWVWPAVWHDNEDIENPHLIVPEDRIWITAGEMRKITRERADAMIAARAEPAEAAEEGVVAGEEAIVASDLPSRRIRIAERGAMGFVSQAAVEAATSIVGSPSARDWLAEGDRVYIGKGEGQVEVGDEFTLFRDAEPVHDIRGGRRLGYHVDILGWLVVRQVEGDSATAEIRMSRSEISRGDRMIPRVEVPAEVELTAAPTWIAGNIVFIPEGRTQVADGDYVYLNRGASEGVVLGAELEVYGPGALRDERVEGKKVTTPDRIEASLVVVDVKHSTAVAYVTGSRRPLEVGDRVRSATREIASR